MKQAKIAVLGVLRVVHGCVSMQGKNVQALAYLPPEAFTEDAKYSPPLDIFSFGHLALYVSDHQFPEISYIKEIMTETRNRRESEVSKRKKWIDQEISCLRDVILLCLKDEPEKRPTAAEVNNMMSTLNNAVNPERKTKVNTCTCMHGLGHVIPI